MQRCKQCQKQKPLSEYLSFASKSIKVKFCNDCSQGNMRRYWAMRSAVTDPAKIARDAKE